MSLDNTNIIAPHNPKTIEQAKEISSINESQLLFAHTFKINSNSASSHYTTVNLYRNGIIEKSFSVKTLGNYKFTLKVKGSLAKNEWPIAELLINDAVVGQQTVTSDIFVERVFEYKITQTDNKLSIKFTNDAYDKESKQDRNLFVKSVKLEYLGK